MSADHGEATSSGDAAAAANSVEAAGHGAEGADVATPQLITTSIVLEWTSEDSMEDVRELIIRGEKFSGFADEAARRLSSALEIVSLSHNSFTGLQQFAPFESLLELNLNFNKVQSLKGLSCRRLKKLFLSNNRVHDLSPLAGMSSLSHLCLYRNEIFDLDKAVSVLRSLSKLRQLDIDGNPCMAKPSSRHTVVRSLPRLSELDGDPLSALDRELADMFFTREGERATKALPPRPSTAPAPGARGGAFGSSSLGGVRGNVRLFRNDSLNENATVLGYLAEGAASGGDASVGAESSQKLTQVELMDTMRRNGGRLTVTDDGEDPVAALNALLSGGSRPQSRDSAAESETSVEDEMAVAQPTAGSSSLLPPPKPKRTLSGRLLAVDPLGSSAERPPRATSPASFVGRMRGLSSGGSDGGRPPSGGSEGTGLKRRGSRGSQSHIQSGGGSRPGSSSSGGSTPRRLASLAHGSSGDLLAGLDGSVPAATEVVPAEDEPRERSQVREAPLPMPAAGSADPSDPHATIRKLLKTIEMMQDERDRLRSALDEAVADVAAAQRTSAAGRARGVRTPSNPDVDVSDRFDGPSYADLSKEVKRLRMENANMYALSDENDRLKARVKDLERKLDEHVLVNENKQLRMDLSEANEQYLVLKSQRDLWELQRPKTAAEVIEEVEDQDAELADLFRRNERTMRSLRKDLSAAKRELSDEGDATSAAREGSGGAGRDRRSSRQSGARAHKSSRASSGSRERRRRAGSGSEERDRGTADVARGSSGGARAVTPPRGARRISGQSPLQKQRTRDRAREKRPTGAAGSATTAGVPEARDVVGEELARPSTANLLSREIESADDVRDAFAALEQSRLRRKELEAARELLESRKESREASGASAADEYADYFAEVKRRALAERGASGGGDDSDDSDDSDGVSDSDADDGGARESKSSDDPRGGRRERVRHTGSADILVIDEA